MRHKIANLTKGDLDITFTVTKNNVLKIYLNKKVVSEEWSEDDHKPSKQSIKIALISLINAIYGDLDEFRNNALSRRELNQRAAVKSWDRVKDFLSKEEVFEINDDWIHYLLNERSTEEFGDTIKKVINNYQLR